MKKNAVKRRATRRIGTALLAVLLIGSMGPAAAQEQAFVTAPSGNQTLADKWQWALAETSTRSGWIVWQISSVLDEKVGPGNFGGYYPTDGLSLNALLEGNRHAQQAYSRQQELLIMVLVERGKPARLEVTSPQRPQQWGHPVHWLGRVSSEESFSLLRAELEPDKPQNLVRELLYAIGLHNHPDRAALLDSLYAAAAWDDFTAAILTSLALQQSPETEKLMLAIAADGQAGLAEREAAIRALAGYDTAAALTLLSTLTDEGQPPALREQAIEALAHFAAEQVATRLNSLAWFDDQSRIRETAVESLTRLGTASAHTQLLELAREHPSAKTREMARESLTDALF